MFFYICSLKKGLTFRQSFITTIQIVEAYQEKYSLRNPVMAIKSMIYHNDINFTEPACI